MWCRLTNPQYVMLFCFVFFPFILGIVTVIDAKYGLQVCDTFETFNTKIIVKTKEVIGKWLTVSIYNNKKIISYSLDRSKCSVLVSEPYVSSFLVISFLLLNLRNCSLACSKQQQIHSHILPPLCYLKGTGQVTSR